MTYDNSDETTGGSLRIDPPPGGGPNEPIGEGLIILSVLAGGYAAAKRRKSKKA
jgi:hypothetical protein